MGESPFNVRNVTSAASAARAAGKFENGDPSARIKKKCRRVLGHGFQEESGD